MSNTEKNTTPIGIDHTEIDINFDPIRQRMSGYATHGMTPFDVPFISHIKGNLYQGGCENGLILPEFIEHVVSLYPWQRYTVNHQLKSYKEIVMYDSLDQGFEQLDSIAERVYQLIQDGPTLVHCQAGLNRSGLVAARVLMLMGFSANESISILRETRSPACLCNPAFERHLREDYK